MPQSETESCPVQKGKPPETQEIELELYFGIFFDGTGANKYQMMLGKKFRLDKMYRKYVHDCNSYKEIKNGNDILKKGRAFWEDEGIFTASELDQMFFDYDGGNLIEKRIKENAEGWENEISSEDSDNRTPHENPMASRPSTNEEIQIVKKTAEQLAEDKELSNDDEIRIHNAEDSMFQGETYTNVAILESCYQYKQEGNKHYVPIYVEGSGVDMQLLSLRNLAHLGQIIEGFAKSTGSIGITPKVTKMVKMIQRKIRSFSLSNQEINKITTVFDVFGFSRGATASRVFTHVVKLANDNSNTTKREVHGLKELAGTNDPFLNKGKRCLTHDVKVRFLGIMDTVSSIGVIRNLNPLYEELIGNIIPKWLQKFDKSIEQDVKDTFIQSLSEYHDRNVQNYGLYDTTAAESVFHICALDEFRRNFALVDIESSIGSNGLEVFLPGCHTDIGGAATIGRDNAKLINKKIKIPDLKINDVIRRYLSDGLKSRWKIFPLIILVLIIFRQPIVFLASRLIAAIFKLYLKDDEIKDDVAKVIKLLKDAYNSHSAVLGGPYEMEGSEVWWPLINSFSKDKAVFLKNSYDALSRIGLLSQVYPAQHNYMGRIEASHLDSLDKSSSSSTLSYVTETDDFFVLYKYTQPGYSNISLDLMYNRYKNKVSDLPMTSLPLGYQIPEQLRSYYGNFNNVVDKAIVYGRYFISPDESTYQWLRRDFLHLSANDQWLDIHANKVVDGPSHCSFFVLNEDGRVMDRIYDDRISGLNECRRIDSTINNNFLVPKALVTRIVYKGVSDNNTAANHNFNWTFLFDYKLDNSNVISVTHKPPGLIDTNLFTRGGYQAINAPFWQEFEENGKKFKRLLQEQSSGGGDYWILETIEISDEESQKGGEDSAPPRDSR